MRVSSASIVHVVIVAAAPWALGGASCLGDAAAREDAGVVVTGANLGINCGDPQSGGNSVGIGQYCTSTSECPIAETGTTIQCSTVLTDNVLPLLCSRICGDETDGGTIDCGSDAVCHNIAELGYDLTVCVPFACDGLFEGGLPRP